MQAAANWEELHESSFVNVLPNGKALDSTSASTKTVQINSSQTSSLTVDNGSNGEHLSNLWSHLATMKRGHPRTLIRENMSTTWLKRNRYFL